MATSTAKKKQMERIVQVPDPLPKPPGIPEHAHTDAFKLIASYERMEKSAPDAFKDADGATRLEELKGDLPEGVKPVSPTDAEKLLLTWFADRLPGAVTIAIKADGTHTVTLDPEWDGGPFNGPVNDALGPLGVGPEVIMRVARSALESWYEECIASALEPHLSSMYPRGGVWSRSEGSIKGGKKGKQGRTSYDGYAIVDKSSAAVGDDAPSVEFTNANEHCRDLGIDPDPVGTRNLASSLKQNGQTLVAIKDGKIATVY